MKTFCLFLIVNFILLNGYSQEQETIPQKKIDTTTNITPEEEFLFMMEGDTTAVKAFHLNEVIILKKLKFKDRLAYKKYLILKRKTLKVYPYAKMASDTLTNLVADLKDISKRRHKKKHIRQMQRFMQKKFNQEIKKMSRTEGRILIRLIHRQTGFTMFELIKEYRNGVKAFLYQKTASIFDLSLKQKFNPTEVYEDYLIEDILERSFQNDILIRQKSPLNYDILELADKWKKPKLTPIN